MPQMQFNRAPKKDCPHAKASGNGKGSDGTTPSFATCWDGVTWAGIAQDTPAQSCDCHTEDEVFMSNSEHEQHKEEHSAK